MRAWLLGKAGAVAAFAAISLLVAGGLGWATGAALRLEREQLDQQAQAEHAEKLRLAMWRLDSRIRAILAREDSRPFNHYSAIFAPPLTIDSAGTPAAPGSVLEPSPLLNTDLPPWMLLHFQADARGWESPQVLSPTLRRWLTARPGSVSLANVTPARQELLAELRRDLRPETFLAQARQHAGETRLHDRVVLARQQEEQSPYGNSLQDVKVLNNTWSDFASRGGAQSKLNYAFRQNEQRVAKDVALLNACRNGEEWLHNGQAQASQNTLNMFSAQAPGGRNQAAGQLLRLPVSAEVSVSMSPMVGLWLRGPAEKQRLVATRLVKLEEKDLCQGILLDGGRLTELLAEEVRDLFPSAAVVAVGETSSETLAETMTTLPLRLDPGESLQSDEPGYTPLRLGLSLAWTAALVALAAVGLGGWSLLDLSERRIRFVSAVTHELRTPLTTLRLYLDMLLGGMVRGEQQREEYLRTLEVETDRLTRLVGNVLDFSRLENQRPRLSLAAVSVTEVLAQTEAAWSGRCANAGKTLIVENEAGAAPLHTDAALLGQILANLIDNACKYSRDAEDARVWLRGRRDGGTITFEVEDRGPGVPAPERRVIFRPFRRGCASDATTGGVGLGLALADRWARLLGGRLVLCPHKAAGACFRVELPLAK
ncbi:MAG: HAMP domain-containing sensor histidine kinase [Gemmataceae bacterium]